MRLYDVRQLRHGDVVVVSRHDSYTQFKTTAVASLVESRRGAVVRLDHRDWVLATHLLNVVSIAHRTRTLGTLVAEEHRIKRAVDQLLLGV